MLSCLFWQATTLETKKSFSCLFRMGDHYFYFLVCFGRRQHSKPRNLQIATGDHYFLAFIEWEITMSIFLLVLAGHNTRNQEIFNSQREIAIFLVSISSFFWQATALETRTFAKHIGRSLLSCFVGVGNHMFFHFLAGDSTRNPDICKSQREITNFLLF